MGTSKLDVSDEGDETLQVMARFSRKIIKQVKTGGKTSRDRDEDETREQVL